MTTAENHPDGDREVAQADRYLELLTDVRTKYHRMWDEMDIALGAAVSANLRNQFVGYMYDPHAAWCRVVSFLASEVGLESQLTRVLSRGDDWPYTPSEPLTDEQIAEFRAERAVVYAVSPEEEARRARVVQAARDAVKDALAAEGYARDGDLIVADEGGAFTVDFEWPVPDRS